MCIKSLPGPVAKPGTGGDTDATADDQIEKSRNPMDVDAERPDDLASAVGKTMRAIPGIST